MAGQVWATNALGGFMWSANLSRKLRTALQPMTRFRQFCDAREAFGLGKGDTFLWDIYSDVATQGSTLDETDVMPETNFTITQGTLTIGEYGNSVPFTKKLDDLSEHPVTEVINKVLKNDARKALESAAYTAFDSGTHNGVGTDASTVSFTLVAPVANNGSVMTKEHVRLYADRMAERDIPTYDGVNYFCIGHPSTFRSLKTELEQVHQYTIEGWHVIMNGEKGRFEGIRFVEQTAIAKEAGTTWDAGSNVSNQAHFFGQDTVVEAFAVPEEIRGKIPTDYGRSRGIAWYANLGYGLVHSASPADAQSRIIKWDSAS
jgi:N4-gp56 family major capsid protein